MMDRRAFMAGMAATIVASHTAESQTVPRVGLISGVMPTTDLPSNPYFAAFVDRLQQLGWRVGDDVIVERRTTEGHADRFDAIITDLLERQVSALVIVSQAGVLAARRLTSKTPIVMVTGAQPVELGLAASLARPGGNVTGQTFIHEPREEGKRLELLSESLPKPMRVAYVAPQWAWDSDYGSTARNAARTLGMSIAFVAGNKRHDFDALPDGVRRTRATALYAFASAENFAFRQPLLEIVTRERLPAMFAHRELAQAGALMSYGANLHDLWHGAAGYVDKILRGARAGDLPIERPARFELVINLKTAKALGLSIPQSLLLRADHVVE
jgi:putative ABC transport system substrate-binding protein